MVALRRPRRGHPARSDQGDGELIPNAQLACSSDASHFALWQDPTAFNKALVAFLAPPTKP